MRSASSGVPRSNAGMLLEYTGAESRDIPGAQAQTIAGESHRNLAESRRTREQVL